MFKKNIQGRYHIHSIILNKNTNTQANPVYQLNSVSNGNSTGVKNV